MSQSPMDPVYAGIKKEFDEQFGIEGKAKFLLEMLILTNQRLDSINETHGGFMTELAARIEALKEGKDATE